MQNQKLKSYPLGRPDAMLVAHDPAVPMTYQAHRQLIEAARAGVKRADFDLFLKRIKRSLVALAEILPASYSSLTKRKVYDTKTSEHILELAELYRVGLDVFGDIQRFNAWLDLPAPSLEGKTPFSLLDTSFGMDLIKVELQKIDYGLPA